MIKLIKSYNYDNNYDYIKLFSSKAEQTAYFNTYSQITINNDIENDSYVKEGETFIVEENYDSLVYENVNYLIFNNNYKDIYAFIVKKEYVDEENTRLYYEIDVLNTYLFDFNINNSFIERKKCSISEICDFDEGIEVGEHEVVEDITAFNKSGTYFAMLSGIRDNTILKDTDDKITNIINTNISISRPVTIIDGIKYPITFIPLTGANETNFNNHLLDCDSVVGIIRFPDCVYTTTAIEIPVLMLDGNGLPQRITIPMSVATVITSSSTGAISNSISVTKSTITDFYPYTYYVLTDGECEPLTMLPQYLPSAFTIKSKYALSHQPVERYYPSHYKGETTGNVYNITNTNQMMLPSGTNTGMSYLNANSSTIQATKDTQLFNFIGASAVGLGSAVMGNVGGVVSSMGSMTNGLMSVKENMARLQDTALTPSSIKSFGTPSTRSNFNTDSVRVLKYTIQDKYKDRLNNYVSRYGNKYNNYAVIDIKSYKGFIKFISPDIDGKIDNMYLSKIINILERGIYIE